MLIIIYYIRWHSLRVCDASLSIRDHCGWLYDALAPPYVGRAGTEFQIDVATASEVELAIDRLLLFTKRTENERCVVFDENFERYVRQHRAFVGALLSTCLSRGAAFYCWCCLPMHRSL